MRPVEPPPSVWELPSAHDADDEGLVAIGADLEPGTLLAAYRGGMFPMPVGRSGPLGWWSPDPRGVLALDGLQVSRSLRRSCREYEIRVDTAFADVIAACADPRRPGGWITPGFEAAYGELHALGWAHSVEAWTHDGELAGGLYGVAVGGLFAGESMFHRRRDASKVALVGLVERLRADGDPRRVLDVQWPTDHLATLGVIGVAREEYLRRLAAALEAPDPDCWV
ncbi:leucyl/phenylalanyl-tRNA--protein transferase [Actinomarinicola tropica]|uniref:Leucyl/phenylalanyl-tRNA--protein transferase n=1 Tax=Actinomarinicola tropica TaxID=2789776 RepID=A0A5Q2RQ48_9ACTN|nr:leucyl/phenylalanyl-tRNA--protein transferase [Actinomarinicola tropica]QGG96566.1 leucyl/phenylalanyl-tRNA--protein transferase [Actinomarinicola tropica]